MQAATIVGIDGCRGSIGGFVRRAPRAILLAAGIFAPLVQAQVTPQYQIQSAPELQFQTSPQYQIQTTPQVQIQTSPQYQIQTSPEIQIQTSPQYQIQTSPGYQIQTTPEIQIDAGLRFDPALMPAVATAPPPAIGPFTSVMPALIDAAHVLGRSAEDVRTQPELQLHGAELLLEGGGEADAAGARRLLEMAAASGVVAAQRKAAQAYESGVGGPHSYDHSIYYYEQAARAGDVQAQVAAGEFHRLGLGKGRPDFQRARRWYEAAAAAGEPQAMLALGDLRRRGLGTTLDRADARRLYERAAAAGEPQAYTRLGDLDREGGNDGLALEHYRRGAALGEPAATVRLADAYAEGRGVRADAFTARSFYLQAAQLGSPEGQTRSGMMLISGEGGPADPPGGIRLLESALDQNHGQAASVLAQVYDGGVAVPRDRRRALRLFQLAGQLDEAPAVQRAAALLDEICRDDADGGCVSVPVLFATDRFNTREADARQRFGNLADAQAGAMHFGVASITVPAPNPGQGQSGRSLFARMWRFVGFAAPDPRTEATLMRVDEMSRQQFFQMLRQASEAGPDNNALVFVHGFNNTFEEAATRLAEFAHSASYPGPLVMYSWPSFASLRMYPADEDAIQRSCHKLSGLLGDVHAAAGSRRPLNILAHSMGARMLFSSLTGGTGSRCEDPGIEFHEVVLAAPDIDARMFSDHVDKFSDNASRVTIYASSKDKALVLESKIIRADYPRLGEGGRRRTVLSPVVGTQTLDASAVEGDVLDHAYVFVNPRVARDAGEVLVGHRQPDDRPGLRRSVQGTFPYWMFTP